MRILLSSALVLLLSTACSSEPTPLPDAGQVGAEGDAGELLDAGELPDGGMQTDAGSESDAGEEPDAGHDADAGEQTDAGPGNDAGEPDLFPRPGFGAIAGDCNVLDDELTSTMPALFVNEIDFGTDPYDASDLPLLTPGGREIIADGNAGGSSLYSEVFSYELLARCEDAELLKTETEILYDTQSKKTDLLVEIDGLKIGVSVTRAVAFPFANPYSVAQAKTLLEGKLGDIHLSTASVSAADAWEKQILYVIAYGPMHATSLQTAYAQIDPAIKGDTVLMIAVSNGDDAFLY